MSNDVSGYGLQLNLVASISFPAGITITQFSDDADPVDMASIQIGDAVTGLNGDLITWRKGVPLPVVINVIPGSDDDRNLSVLFENNRVGRGKVSVNDVLTLTAIYPDGDIVTFTQGTVTDFMPGRSVAGAGRIKTRNYGMKFENRIEALAQ